MSKSSCSHSRNSENLNLNHCCQTSKYDSDGDINMQVLFSSPPSILSIIYFILTVDNVSFIKQDSFVPTLCPPNELLAAARLFSDQTKPIILAPARAPHTWSGSWSDAHLGMLTKRDIEDNMWQNIQDLAKVFWCDIIFSGPIWWNWWMIIPVETNLSLLE